MRDCSRQVFPKYKPIRLARSKRSGVAISVASIHRKLRSNNPGIHVQTPAAVYMAAVLENWMTEVVAQAGNIAMQHGKRRLTSKHLRLALKSEELSGLPDFPILQRGAISNGESAVSPKNTKKDQPKQEAIAPRNDGIDDVPQSNF